MSFQLRFCMKMKKKDRKNDFLEIKLGMFEKNIYLCTGKYR